jgi:hypothetical protein
MSFCRRTPKGSFLKLAEARVHAYAAPWRQLSWVPPLRRHKIFCRRQLRYNKNSPLAYFKKLPSELSSSVSSIKRCAASACSAGRRSRSRKSCPRTSAPSVATADVSSATAGIDFTKLRFFRPKSFRTKFRPQMVDSFPPGSNICSLLFYTNVGSRGILKPYM